MPPSSSFTALQDKIEEATQRLRPHVLETPLRRARGLGREVGSPVWLKCEHLQHTGSFKLRGATNKLLTLDSSVRARGVVTASSGNHGMAVAHACQRLQVPATVFVPQGVTATKAAAIRDLGAHLKTHGSDCADTETHAREFAITQGLPFVSPYNDIDVISGQGSIAGELVRQTRPLDVIYVAVGGGGLVAGIGAGLKRAWPDTDIVGCSPTNSAVMLDSLAAGEQLEVDSLPTWSDGTAGGLEAQTITFPLCAEVMTRTIKVSEDAILDGVRWLRRDLNAVVEGAAGVAVAAMLQDPDRRKADRIGLIVCGGNASTELRSALGSDL